MTMTMHCPYCGMSWSVSSAIEAGRLIDRHQDGCERAPEDAV